jgi:hypothetical protein
MAEVDVSGANPHVVEAKGGFFAWVRRLFTPSCVSAKKEVVEAVAAIVAATDEKKEAGEVLAAVVAVGEAVVAVAAAAAEAASVAEAAPVGASRTCREAGDPRCRRPGRP